MAFEAAFYSRPTYGMVAVHAYKFMQIRFFHNQCSIILFQKASLDLYLNKVQGIGLGCWFPGHSLAGFY